MPPIRDRIVDFRRVPAGSLRANPRNWRTHPQAQRVALDAALAEIGFASALLARELPDGALELIDGHLRAETAADEAVPVLVLDVDEREAAQLLATFDPLSALAGVDSAALESLLDEIDFAAPALRSLTESLLAESLLEDEASAAAREREQSSDADLETPELYQIVVECRAEAEQRELFERLRAEGFRCRLVNL